MPGGYINAGVIKQGGARVIGFSNNLGLAAATTTNANDSIKITGSDGTALSPFNYGWVSLFSATSGQITVFSVTADVTILLTGAHWGLGTFGDRTDYPLSVYALNDAGTLKWGVGAVPNHKLILNADDSATPTDINLVDEILVNSALTADSPCLEIGWFKGNFDDTGGAAEDLWAIQTGDNDINLGVCPLIWKPYSLTIGAETTAPTKATTTEQDAAYWARDGSDVLCRYDYEAASATGSAAGTGIYLWPVPTGLSMTQIVAPATSNRQGSVLGSAYMNDTSYAGGAAYGGQGVVLGYNTAHVKVSVAGAIIIRESILGSAYFPINVANHSYSLNWQAPITGWY